MSCVHAYPDGMGDEEPTQLRNYQVIYIDARGRQRAMLVAALDEESALDIAADSLGPGARPTEAHYRGLGDVI